VQVAVAFDAPGEDDPVRVGPHIRVPVPGRSDPRAVRARGCRRPRGRAAGAVPGDVPVPVQFPGGVDAVDDTAPAAEHPWEHVETGADPGATVRVPGAR